MQLNLGITRDLSSGGIETHLWDVTASVLLLGEQCARTFSHGAW